MQIDRFDVYGSTVRRVTVSSRAVTTLLGSTNPANISDGVGAAAGFSQLGGIAMDAAGATAAVVSRFHSKQPRTYRKSFPRSTLVCSQMSSLLPFDVSSYRRQVARPLWASPIHEATLMEVPLALCSYNRRG